MLYRMRCKVRSLLKDFPTVEYFLKKISYQKRFKTELELIKGIHKNSNKHSSIIHFSFNKAATQYVKSILRRCAIENGMVPVSIHGYAFNSDFPYLDHLSSKEMEKYKHIFKKSGYLYSVFSGMIEGIPSLEKYKVVLVTRDPRDILISDYYSIAYSHPVPIGKKRDAFLLKRMQARESTIDEYVLSQSDKLYNIFYRYQSLLLDRYMNVYLTTYEDMVRNFNGWLSDLLYYCELNISKRLLQSLLEENKHIKPKKENIWEHIRKGQPGDYKKKLKKETIEHLNNKFASILVRYKYNQ